MNSLHSKTKVVNEHVYKAEDVPQWSYDGSSTNQAVGEDSDLLLQPVNVFPDPLRDDDDLLVVCEVLNPDGTPHEDNTRRRLVNEIDQKVLDEDPWFGLEQEYTMLASNGWPYNWPQAGYPEPQGNNYCSVGNNSVYGRDLAEAHLQACIDAGLNISGINAEVMPSQWEYQIGPVGPLELGDSLTVSRWLLHRLGEEYGITITFEPKPVRGDWNGAGAHTNFSTKSMRQEGGLKVIQDAIDNLGKAHAEHIAQVRISLFSRHAYCACKLNVLATLITLLHLFMQYGTGNEYRLTGQHETADINTFSSGTADRGSSIRIPRPVERKGYGFLEDRRPSANCDPYTVRCNVAAAAVCFGVNKASAWTDWTAVPLCDVQVAYLLIKNTIHAAA